MNDICNIYLGHVTLKFMFRCFECKWNNLGWSLMDFAPNFLVLLSLIFWMWRLNLKMCDFSSCHLQCSHDYICQRLTKDKMRPCNFEQTFEPLNIPGMKKIFKSLERFSYLVMRKGRTKEGKVFVICNILYHLFLFAVTPLAVNDMPQSVAIKSTNA